jgi:nucleotide-binding universal stress UspA family protein
MATKRVSSPARARAGRSAAAQFTRILVPVDFSDQSQFALDHAVELSRAFRAELLVLHVVEPVFLPGGGDAFGGGYDTRLVYEEIERSAREQLARVAAGLANRGVAARTLLHVGTAHEAIIDTARKVRADLIVMSTHGRSGLSHLFMGSVAERVVRSAACPVLTMRDTRPARMRRPARTTRAARRRAPAK